MTSSDERRKVAARLRALAETPDEIGITEHAVIRTLGISSGYFDDCCRSEDVERLANLIESQPDLCWDVGGHQDVFECSECRCKVELVTEVCNEYGEPFSEPLIPRFCPNCGRGIARAIER